MQFARAEALARELMAKYGLTNWTFGFDGAKRRLGACWLDRKRITLSKHFVRLNPEPMVRDVILHEIAHALTPGEGHGPEFKRKATELGCSPASCIPSDKVVSSPPRVVLECPHCGRTWHRYRKPSRKLICGPCSHRRSSSKPLRVRLLAAA